MKCGRYEEWIALEAGGDLPRKEAERLRRHLAECPACRNFAEAVAAARAEFRTLADDQTDETDLAAVRRGVKARIAQHQRPRSALGWRWVLAGATAALVLIAAVSLAPEGHEAPAPAIATNRAATVTERQHPSPGTSREPARAANAVSGFKQTPRAKRATSSAAVRTTRHKPEAAPSAAPSVVAVSPDVVRIQTPDPNVVVYWVLETTENEEETGDES